MATLKFVIEAKKYHDEEAVRDVLMYIMCPDKTPHGWICSAGVDMTDPAKSMKDVAQYYKKDFGVRVRHMILSFEKDDITSAGVPLYVAEKISKIIGRIYQTVCAVHEDTPNHPHIHIVFNPVSFVNGYKYHGDKQDYYGMITHIQRAVSSFGLGYVRVVK